MHCMLAVINQLTACLLTLGQGSELVGISTTATVNELLTLLAGGVVEVMWKIPSTESNFRCLRAQN